MTTARICGFALAGLLLAACDDPSASNPPARTPGMSMPAKPTPPVAPPPATDPVTPAPPMSGTPSDGSGMTTTTDADHTDHADHADHADHEDDAGTMTAPPTTAPAGTEGADAAAADSDDAEEAKTLLQQAATHIKENKYDLAEKALEKLEGMADKLPTSLQSQIKQARTTLDVAKGASELKVPEALPGMK